MKGNRTSKGGSIGITLAFLLVGIVNVAPSATAGECPYEDNSSGVGGQEGSCTFECPGPQGFVNAQIDATDNDALASVTGSCGPHDTHCSGKGGCSATPVAYSGSQGGQCEGYTQENWDSGIYINCWANEEDGPPPPDECILEEPIEVCRPSGPGSLELDPNELVELICENSSPGRCIPKCEDASDLIGGISMGDPCKVVFFPDLTKASEVIMAVIKDKDGVVDELAILCGLECVTFTPLNDVEDGVRRISSCTLPLSVCS